MSTQPLSRSRAVLALGGWLLLCFAAAVPGGWFMPGAWYAALHKPAWNPPGWVFGPVWTEIYLAWVGFAAFLNFTLWRLNP